MILVFHFIFLIILLLASAFFSSSETAIFSLTPFEIKKLKDKFPVKVKLIDTLIKDSEGTISTIVIGNTVVNIIASSILGTVLFLLFPKINLIISMIIVSAMILIIGEVSPKLIALRIYKKLVIFYAPILEKIYYLISPIRKLFFSLVVKLFDSLGIKRKPEVPSIEEVEAIVDVGEKEGLVEKDQKEMIEKMFDLSQRGVDEIMTPRVNMMAVKKGTSRDELISKIKESRHTRIPIYKDNIDNILGIVYVKELFFLKKYDLDKLIHPILFVPESMRIDELLFKLKEKDEDVAIVVDEYGGTAGIITMEDIIEEIVGEIEEEWKKEKQFIRKVSEDTYSVRADISLKQLSDFLNVDLKTEEAETLGGFLMFLFREVPSSGQSIEYKGVKFFIDDVRQNRITTVTIKKH
jgi:CBS domain containing-hemolysin-like protein